MKNVLIALLLFAPAFALAEKPTSNPADYAVVVHVQASHIASNCSDVTGGSSVCFWEHHLNVTIDAKKYELTSIRALKAVFALHVGDYKAKVLKEDTSKDYEYQRSYELLYPDGQTEDFQVMGESE
jgi:hypothetical protein